LGQAEREHSLPHTRRSDKQIRISQPATCQHCAELCHNVVVTFDALPAHRFLRHAISQCWAILLLDFVQVRHAQLPVLIEILNVRADFFQG